MLLRGILLFSLIWGTASFALAETPQVYYVKKGDTLWGISERFIKDPFFWPNLWAKNGDIPNPHLIYPGQKLLIYKDRIEVIPVTPEPAPTETAAASPAPQVETIAPPPPPAQVETVKIPQLSTSFITTAELEESGTLVDTVDARIMISHADTVFVKMHDLSATRPGDKYTLFRVDRQVFHPKTEEPVGYKVFDLGTLEIVAIEEDVATARITDVEREIERGARLRPYVEPIREVALKKPGHELTGYLVTSINDRVTIGSFDVIYVDLGKEDGLYIGNALNIYRPRQATLEALQRESTVLPNKDLGRAVVIQVRDRTATALVTEALDYIENGDRVTTAGN